MNLCIRYLRDSETTDVLSVCARDAPFLVKGSSWCFEHVLEALSGQNELPHTKTPIIGKGRRS